MSLTFARRSRWGLVAGVAGALILPAWQITAQDSISETFTAGQEAALTAVKASDNPELEAQKSDAGDEIVDLTDKVEVRVNGGLRSRARTNHSAAVVVKNISTEDLKGPLVIVIDGTGVAALVVKDAAGELESGESYVEILGERGTLKAGASLRAQKIEFTSEDVLSAGQRDQFELKTRVLYLPEEGRTAQAEEDDQQKNIPGKNYSEKDFDRVAMIQEKWTLDFLKRGNGLVYGTGVAENDDGELVMEVYVQRPSVDELLPDEVDGVPVEVMNTGTPFRAGPAFDKVIYENGRPKRGGEGFPNGVAPTPDPDPESGEAQATERPLPVINDPTLFYPRPVPIGVSISNADRLFDPDPPGAICYSGTLGCRVVDALGTEYILTNCHVGGAFAVAPSGSPPIGFMTGFLGEPIVQPSTGDDLLNFCTFDPANQIGTLVDIETIFTTTAGSAFSVGAPINIMDAALVLAVPGAVGFAPPEGGYGTLKRDVMNRPRLGTRVQKYGRTSIYTDGQIVSMNLLAVIAYGPGPNDVGVFIKQIGIANMAAFGHPFGVPGDSGSLIVANTPGEPTDRQPVGLLYAGGPQGAVDLTIANPLGPILTRFNVQIDDGSGAPFQAGQSGTQGGVLGPLDPPSESF